MKDVLPMDVETTLLLEEKTARSMGGSAFELPANDAVNVTAVSVVVRRENLVIQAKPFGVLANPWVQRSEV